MDKTPDLIIFDNANDGNLDSVCLEAFIRRIFTEFPNCKIVLLGPVGVADRLVDDSINSPTTQGLIDVVTALVNNYGLSQIHYLARLQDLVNNDGFSLSKYFIDTIHPSPDGHSEISSLLEPILTASFLSNPQRSGDLPDRLYDNGDYENTATIKNGTDYDSKTGTWTEDGTSISSSEANATITFSGTFIRIGRPEKDGVVQVSFDGGDYRTFTFSPNGATHSDIATRAAHTATIKVISGTVTISEFWAI